MEDTQTDAARAKRRIHMEAALADYPHLSEERLAALLGWFRKEATALDVAMVASNPDIVEPYRRFRAEHIDPISGKDWIKGLLIAGLAGLLVLVIVWRAF
ncbi:hypothetical protein WG901_15895 [Novosphingobium sp. PS1R-30]|uniref:Uncharacterized protein n=1 Tax=Novosphingobium anseongense TaxID=3133436 RepID=A0ABU8RYH7_9SPHN|nr:MAG: hypothetical protein EOO76_08955 [Novosphingobium sp.]